MIRWLSVPTEIVFTDYTVKMYRPLVEPKTKLKTEFKPERGLDMYAKEHLGSELFNYKIIDTNRVKICECLGDLDLIKVLEIPID